MPRLHRCCTTGHTAFNKTTDSLYVQMYFSPSFTRACKARVRFSERSFPPGYGSDSCTVFVTVLLPTQRPGHALCTTSILYTINITVPIKCAFDVSIFGPVHFFLTPPHTFPLISVIAFYTHGTLAYYLVYLWREVLCTGPSQDFFPLGNISRVYVRWRDDDVQSMSPNVHLRASF